MFCHPDQLAPILENLPPSEQETLSQALFLDFSAIMESAPEDDLAGVFDRAFIMPIPEAHRSRFEALGLLQPVPAEGFLPPLSKPTVKGLCVMLEMKRQSELDLAAYRVVRRLVLELHGILRKSEAWAGLEQSVGTARHIRDVQCTETLQAAVKDMVALIKQHL